jgi:diguanylate cyclase
VAVPSNEHERTLAFAEIALQQIRALRLPASPRNFEIWYQYATGYSPGLNRTINDTLAQKGTLEESDIERIYDTYLSPGRVTDRLDSVGSRMAAEITQVLATIDAAAGSATSCSASLADASEELQGASDNLHGGSDGLALRAVIERLITGAKEMETSNRKLEARLSASREEIEQLQQNLEIVRTESLTDPLTTLANRKFFDAELDRAVAEAKAVYEPLALLMCDVDHFRPSTIQCSKGSNFTELSPRQRIPVCYMSALTRAHWQSAAGIERAPRRGRSLEFANPVYGLWPCYRLG